MKKTKKTIAILIIMLVYFQCISMNLQYHKNQNFFITSPPDTIESYYENTHIIEPLDTIINNYKVHYYAVKDTGYIINYSYSDYNVIKNYYPNYKLFLEITKDGNIIYHQYIFKENFKIIIKNDIAKMALTGFWFENFEKDIFNFKISICVPDTDICYFIAIYINTSGDMKFEEIFYEFEDE